ncbi:MAG TPA: hypothetical protein VIK42_07005, partial [Bacteroidales bacterium]
DAGKFFFYYYSHKNHYPNNSTFLWAEIMLANKFSAEVIQTFSFNKKGCQFLLNIPLVCFTRWKN